MPSHKTHRQIDRYFFGRSYDRIHKFKDLPARWLGPSHRRVLHNNVMHNLILGALIYPNDPYRAALSAILHDKADVLFTAYKRSRRWRRGRW